MATLILILATLTLTATLYTAIEALFGELVAAILNPVGWAVVKAAETAVELARGEE